MQQQRNEEKPRTWRVIHIILEKKKAGNLHIQTTKPGRDGNRRSYPGYNEGLSLLAFFICTLELLH